VCVSSIGEHVTQSSINALCITGTMRIYFDRSIEHLGHGLHFGVIAIASVLTLARNVLIPVFGDILREVVAIRFLLRGKPSTWWLLLVLLFTHRCKQQWLLCYIPCNPSTVYAFDRASRDHRRFGPLQCNVNVPHQSTHSTKPCFANPYLHYGTSSFHPQPLA
jgi:hypothetical protein